MVDGTPNQKRVGCVIFCVFNVDDVAAYDRYLHTWFPTDPDQVGFIKLLMDVMGFIKLLMSNTQLLKCQVFS